MRVVPRALVLDGHVAFRRTTLDGREVMPRIVSTGELAPLTVASALWAQTHSVGSAAQVSSLDQASERRAKHAPSLPKEPSNHKTKPIAGPPHGTKTKPSARNG